MTDSAVNTVGSTVSGTRVLDAFGNARTAATGSLATSAIGFAGQYLESATGLYDMRARDYSSATGRFTANDPVAVPTGMPYVAGYAYAYNNPLIHTDASGMCVGIKGTTQDRRCTYNDYYWYGIPGALGEQFTAAWAGASDGVGFNVPMLLDCSSYNKYKDNSAYWIGDVVGVLTAAATFTVAADIRIPTAWASRSNEATDVEAATGGAAVVRMGQAVENAVRDMYAIGPKATRVIGGNTRIFDGLNAEAVSEVKNVAYQAFTQQLKDSLSYAVDNGLDFDLYVRGGSHPTILSAPLQDAIAGNSRFNLRFIP